MQRIQVVANVDFKRNVVNQVKFFPVFGLKYKTHVFQSNRVNIIEFVWVCLLGILLKLALLELSEV